MTTIAAKPTAQEILEDCAARLEATGEHSLSTSVQILSSTASNDVVSVSEAAAIARVSHQTIKNWIARGLVLSTQPSKGRRHQIDRDSLLRVIDRRRGIDAAKRAFETRETAVEFISGLDAATLKRLGGV